MYNLHNCYTLLGAMGGQVSKWGARSLIGPQKLPLHVTPWRTCRTMRIARCEPNVMALCMTGLTKQTLCRPQPTNKINGTIY